MSKKYFFELESSRAPVKVIKFIVNKKLDRISSLTLEKHSLLPWSRDDRPMSYRQTF